MAGRSPKFQIGLGSKILVLFLALMALPSILNFWGVFSWWEVTLKELILTLQELGQIEAANNISASIDQQRAQFVLASFIALFLATVTALLLTRIMVTPLRRILSAIQWISRGGKPIPLPATGRDELAQLARSFNDLVNQLIETGRREQELIKLKSEFISVAAHQLRTPLSTIKWTFRMALDEDVGPLTAKQKEFLMRGFISNERMIKLVSDLLDASRIEEGRFGYSFQVGSLETVLEQEIEQAKQFGMTKKITIEYQKPEKALSPFVMDPQRLGMVFSNLLSNAVQYTLPNGKIFIRLISQKGGARIEIQDTGVGIPKEDIPRLFAKFFRAENVIHMQTEGTGMGLYISRNIARAHGGDISVASEEGRGSMLTVTIPFAGPESIIAA